MHKRSRTALGAMTALALAIGAVAPAAAAGTATYEVTITNLAPGQPLTPPIVAIHRGSTGLFAIGGAASTGIREIAENGNGGPLLEWLDANRNVTAVHAADLPLVGPGSPAAADFSDSVTFTIETSRDGRFLSWASMLICTNDGFTGVNRLKLPNAVGGSATAQTAGYDAGTEINTEAFANIVQGCQALSGLPLVDGSDTSDSTLAEGGVIHHHAPIVGSADLDPAVHGWSGAVASITVTRIG